MLTTRPAKRDKAGFLSTALMFDVLDEGKPIGGLVFGKETSITLDGKSYSVQRMNDKPDEMLYQALIRVLSGSEKPPANPWALKDSSGRILALAESMKRNFAVSRGGESFSLRKTFGSRPYHLYREGRDQSLGSVGQEKFFSRTLHMNLPAEFEPAFQVFLLVLLIDLSMKQLENNSSYTP